MSLWEITVIQSNLQCFPQLSYAVIASAVLKYQLRCIVLEQTDVQAKKTWGRWHKTFLCWGKKLILKWRESPHVRKFHKWVAQNIFEWSFKSSRECPLECSTQDRDFRAHGDMNEYIELNSSNWHSAGRHRTVKCCDTNNKMKRGGSHCKRVCRELFYFFCSQS